MTDIAKRPRTPSGRPEPRRGVVTLWTLIFLPALVILLCVVVEIAHLWLCRAQLENGLEAAALAAAKQWGYQQGGDTQVPRNYGIAYAASNAVNGQPLAITDNYGPGSIPNQNAQVYYNLVGGRVQGNLIFGAVSLAPPYTFNAGVAPQCEQIINYGSVGLRFVMETRAGRSTFADPNVYTVEFKSGPAGVYITKLTYNLQTTSVDNGEFNVDTTPSRPAVEDLANGAVREGWGPFFNLGASSGIAGPVAFSPDGSTPGVSPKLEVDFAPADFGVGDTFVFGVDTDKLGNGLADVNDTADEGSAFKDAGSAFSITVEFNNGAKVTLSGDSDDFQRGDKKTFTPPGLTKDMVIIVPATGEFGVRAQATVDVQPLCHSLLGIPIGPFPISAFATARAGCTTSNPQLIHAVDYLPH